MVIAVSAISGVVDSLPKKLQQLVQQSALSWLDRPYVVRLKDELELIRGAFEQYSTLDNPTEFTRQWAQKVREVAYDIEELIDRYINRVGDVGNDIASGGTLSRLAGFFVAKIKWGHAHRRSISDELKLQWERLHVQVLEKPTFMTTSTTRPGSYSRRTTTTAELQLANPLLVGMDEAREEVTNMVMDGGSVAGVKVISIVGMAGAGKTTLATEVYRRCEYYHYRAFVSVGRRPDDLCTVLKGVVSDVAGGDNGGQNAADNDELLNVKAIIRERLQHTRYLIVLDDLWSTEAWREIKSCFPSNNLGSRIVTTTRIEAVAKTCCSSPNDCVFKIPLLNESDSETLFFARIFGSIYYHGSDLRDSSMHILRKCSGLPLAIVNIAEDLINKRSIATALKTYELDLQSKSLRRMKEVLDHSYNDLPKQLKTCLLYISIFPENYEIRRQRLIRRWIAEGFIDDEQGMNREETATKYFNELINRNLIQPGQVDYDGNARSCRVHPVMLDFIVCKSMEEKFVTLLHPGRQKNGSPNKGLSRWLSLRCEAKADHETVQDKSTNLFHTRSFTLFGHIDGMPELAEMKMLRVLDLEDCEGPLHGSLDVLPELFLLRYLSLKGTDVMRLPSQIGKLSYLETLDIRATGIQELPPSTVQLHKLVHLLAGVVALPRGIKKMRALQTLSYANIRKSSASVVRELGDLIGLKKLAIFCSQEDRHSMVPILKKLAAYSLRSLVVASSGSCWMESSHPLPTPPRFSLQRFMIDESAPRRVPEWVASSSVNLVEMDISFHQLNVQDLRILEGLVSLLRLCLDLMFIPGELKFREGGLPSLRELCLLCRNLPSLTFDAGALPMLERLELNFQKCSLSEEPAVSGVECLSSLKHAIVAFPHEDVGTKVVAEVRKAALLHPNHPEVVVKTGKEVSSVGNNDFEELDPLSHESASSPVEPKSNIESTHKYLIDMVQVIATHSFLQAPNRTAASSVGYVGILLVFVHQYLRMLCSSSSRFKGLVIYMDTGATVIIAHAFLLLINFGYIVLLPFPICLVGFVGYLFNEIWVKGRLQQHRSRSQDNPRKVTKKFEGPVATPMHHSGSKDDLGKGTNECVEPETTAMSTSGSKDTLGRDDDKSEGSDAAHMHPRIFSSKLKDDLHEGTKKFIEPNNSRSTDNLGKDAMDFKQPAVAIPMQPSRWKNDLDKDSKKIVELVRTAVIPYFMLSIDAQHGDSSPALSHFLLFSCGVLGILALMYFKLAAEVSPVLTPALEWIQRAYIVMLFITVHTVAAESLGEVTALICIPELISGLLWFATLLDNGRFNAVVDKITKDKYGIIFIPLGAVLARLASFYGYEGELQPSRYKAAMVACGVAGCLPCLSVWMISRWPGSVPGSEKAIQVLKFLAKVCLSGACIMLLALPVEKTLAYDLFGLDDLVDPSV